MKYKASRNGKSDGKYLEDKVKQNFNPQKLNQVWAGDITYIKTKLGFVYLAAVLDLCNREVIGYQVAKRIDTELAHQMNALLTQSLQCCNVVFYIFFTID